MQATEAFLAVFETEPWNSSPASSAPGDARNWEREAFVVAARFLYFFISAMEASWIASVASGEIPYLETEDHNFDIVYRGWLEVCDKTIAGLGVAGPGGLQGAWAGDLLQDIE